MKGRVVAEGYRIAVGLWVELVLGRGWEKRTFPSMGREEEKVWWKEFCAYKVEWLARRDNRRAG